MLIGIDWGGTKIEGVAMERDGRELLRLRAATPRHDYQGCLTAIRAMVDALAKGDEVVIGGGVLGKVAKLGETYLSVEVATGVELQVQRTSVLQVLPKGTIK